MRGRLAAIAASVAMAWTGPGSGPALAWGYYGHRTVATIAMDNMAPATAAQVRSLLRSERALGTPQCRVRTLEDASTWPDCIRGESWRWAYTFPWHYQDEPVCGAFDIKTDCAFGNCVTAQIERNRRILADPGLPAGERLMALAFVAHFVGDVHQPLHVGENHDKGGNEVTVRYGLGMPGNLHAIWDTALAERAISEAGPTLVRRYSATERAALATGSVADWARESWQISKDFLYPTAFGTLPCDGNEPKDVTWNEAAIAASLPIIDRRIEQAGLRLATLLDEALSSPQ